MTVKFDDFKREAKVRELKAKAKAGFDKTKQLVTEHPAESLALATTAIGTVIGLVRRADRKADLKKAEQLKERYIYANTRGFCQEFGRLLSRIRRLRKNGARFEKNDGRFEKNSGRFWKNARRF